MSGFSKEQLALAKQLQSGYIQSGTFHPQGQGSTPKSSIPSLHASAAAHNSHPIRSQSSTPTRSVNGLVRPLSSKAPVQTPAPAVRHAPSARPSPAQGTVPSTSAKHSSMQPATGSAFARVNRAPPVQPLSSSPSYIMQPPMPTNLQPALTPTPLFPKATQQATWSTTPAAVPRGSQNSTLLENSISTISLNADQTVSAARGEDPVAKAIKINQMGKPIKWNWASEEPVVRELSDVEVEQLTTPSVLPPMVYDKPFHANASMKAPSLGGSGPEGCESPPRKIVGLKGSRFAQ